MQISLKVEGKELDISNSPDKVFNYMVCLVYAAERVNYSVKEAQARVASYTNRSVDSIRRIIRVVADETV